MNTETINAIKEALLPIAEKIGQGAGFVWEVVLRQQYVIAMFALFSVSLGLVGLVFVYHVIKKVENEDVRIGTSIFVGIPSLAGIIIGAVYAMGHLMNPEYYALEYFISLVR